MAHVSDLSLNYLLGAPLLFGGASRLSGSREGVANRRQWIAELVREQRQELVLAAVGFAQRLFTLAQCLLELAALDEVTRLTQVQVEAPQILLARAIHG